MDGVSEWRLIEPDQTRTQAAEPREPAHESQRLWIAMVAALVLLSAGVAIWATLPAGGVQIDTRNAMGVPAAPRIDPVIGGGAAGAPSALPGGASAAIVVDVQGAVADPGLRTLPEGSRVGDAIAAAGGYSAAVDVVAASAQLNLAARLADGDQVRVPRLGEDGAAASAPAGDGQGVRGLIDVNTASAEELDTLPGIGPVTAAKIIDAREQAPFATVDELLSREVVGAATFEKVRDLVTVRR